MTRTWPWGLTAALIAALAVAAIVATYAPLSATWDEPAHLAAGIERLDLDRYSYEQQHPPLSRIAAAVLPYMDGMRSLGKSHIFDEGIALLASAPDPDAALTRARLGLLPFFLLLLAAAWLWTARVAGPAAATVAVLALATTPPLLGNAGLAITDVASVAGLTACFLAFGLWLDRPGWSGAVALGVALALALGTKYSAIPFLGLTVLTWIAVRWAVGGGARPALPWRPGQYALALAVTLGLLWPLYGVDLGPLLDPADAPYEALDARIGAEGWPHDLAYAVVQAPVYPRFVESILRGVQSVAHHNAGGHTSFLLGEVRAHGWWYFYPVALAVRTPLPLLLGGLAGLAWMAAAGWRLRDWRLVAPAPTFVVLLAFICAVSNINIGVRHAFVLYPLLALGAGWAAWRLVRAGWPGRVAVALALAAQMASAVLAHPDHVAYFNLLARGQPERILINGDLDWGQDLKRLAAAVRERGIERIAVAYNGSADPARVVPGFEPLQPNRAQTGWIALSLLLSFDETCGSYRWLAEYEPVTTVGHSIRLYRIDALRPDAAVPTAPADLQNGRCRRLLRIAD